MQELALLVLFLETKRLCSAHLLLDTVIFQGFDLHGPLVVITFLLLCESLEGGLEKALCIRY